MKKFGVEIVFTSNDSTYHKLNEEQLINMFLEYSDDSKRYFHAGKSMITKVNDKGNKWIKQIIVEKV